MILRPQYLDALRTYCDVSLVKILAGIRRCVKSLKDYIEERAVSIANYIIA